MRTELEDRRVYLPASKEREHLLQQMERAKKWQNRGWAFAAVVIIMVITYFAVLAWTIETGGAQ